MALYLKNPSIDMKDAFLDYVAEWKDESQFVPNCCELKGRTFEVWLSDNLLAQHGINLPPMVVPSTTYFLVDETGYIYGALDFRHYLNQNLRLLGGHIGYGIRPSQRGKGLAKLMLAYALEVARRKGYSKVMISCDKLNIPSRRTILSQGGILESELQYQGAIYQRYWIYLK